MKKILIFQVISFSRFEEKLKVKFSRFQPLMEAKIKVFSGCDIFKTLISWSLRLWRTVQTLRDVFDLLDE